MKRPRAQAAAVPWRRSPEGMVEVLMVSTRSGGWTVPKGGVKRKATPAETARAEAREEAGAEGVLGQLLGRFAFEKRGQPHEALAFGLEVRRLLPRWDEDRRRVRTWIAIDRAPALARRPQVAAMIRELALVLLAAQRSVSAAA